MSSRRKCASTWEKDGAGARLLWWGPINIERRLSRAWFLAYRNLGTFNLVRELSNDRCHGYVIKRTLFCFSHELQIGVLYNISAWGLGLLVSTRWVS